MLLNGSQILVECLLEQGVDTVFGYPGGAVLNIYDELYKYSDRITHIETSHEQNAGHAADGYSRTTGKTGVVIATSGPGATNLVTPIATANMDSIPMVAITGNVGRSLLGLDSFQEVDIVSITKPVTKASFQIGDVSELADTVRKAFYIANEGRKGPVLIDIPKDITAAMYEYEPKTPEVPSCVCNLSNIDEAAALIAAAQRPLIIAGGGVILGNAEDQLAALADRIDAAVAVTLMGTCSIPGSSHRFTGMLGMHGTKTSSMALTGSDLIIACGCRFSDRVTCSTDSFAENIKGAKLIHIDIDEKEKNKNVRAGLFIHSDLAPALSALLEKLPQQSHSEWMDSVDGWKKEYPLCQKSEDGVGVLPQQVLEALCDLTDGNAIITTEVGQHQIWAAQFYSFESKKSLVTSGGLGTMGYGLGAAIGSKLGNPERQVINIAGDGSLYMNLAELSTLAKYNIPVVEMVFNNSVLGMVRQWQRLFYGGRFSQTTLEKTTDLEAMAKAFGIEAVTVSNADELEEKLSWALSCGRPVIVNCIIGKDVNVLPMVPAGASVAEPILEL